MKLLKYILLCFSIISYSLCEDVEITVISDPFTIDTVVPEIELYSPSHGDVYGPFDVIEVSWNASDQSPATSPMTLYVSADLDNPYMELFTGFPNSGYLELDVPDFINTLFASVRLDIVDYYGNTSYAYSNGYFTLGNPNEGLYDVIDESISIQSNSQPFEIDTKTPEVVWIFPNQATSFNPLQGQVVRWNATDETLPENPIDLLFVDGGVDSYFLGEDVINNGQKFIYLPDIETSLGHFKVIATDSYGNVGYDLSDEYMTVGEDSDTEVQDENVTIEVESEPFEIDTKLPLFSLINENDYFYPNGGELLTDYSNIDLNWNASDDSFENGQVEVSLAYLLGGWYTSLGSFEAQNPYTAVADFSIDGLVENTIWARLIYTAIDDYGNSNSQYSDDYFTLGSSDGDISAELYDEDNIDMFLGWTWDSSKHRVRITPRALEALEAGDQIIIVGENATQNSDCLSPSGITNLGSTEVVLGVDDGNITDHVVINKGINHCEYGGGALPGYALGDTVRIQILKSDDTSYFLRPSEYRGSVVFDDGHTIIKEFNTNPYALDGVNSASIDLLDERDWDSFNVYGKVANHQGSSRTCDGDGVCDTSELLDLYTNESDCTENSGIWNDSLCYYDYNEDGEYSPDEVDENIADCYSDCCSQQGTGENEEWCFIENVNAEEYTHSLVHSNYLPAETSSATVNYRVWLLDDQENEIYKTVDTDGFDIQIGTDDIPDYINNLESGWNWISLNISEDNMLLNNIFSSSTLSDQDYIKSQTTSSLYYASGNQWYPDWDMDLLNAYLVDVNQGTSILYQGTYSNPQDITIPLSSGWNWIGYTPDISSDINTALASLSPDDQDYIKSQTASSTYYASGGVWYPDITLEPTKGYMIKSASEQTLIYPDIERNTEGNIAYKPDFNYRDYEYNASITVEIQMPHLEISLNDKIEVYYERELRGIAVPQTCPLNDKLLFNLMLYSNKELENDFSFVYYNAENNQEYLGREIIDFKRDDIIGSAYSPFTLTDIAMPIHYELKNPYPNPFNPITTIEFSLMQDHQNFALKIFDIRGRLVESIYSGYIKYGFHKYNWDASRYASGLYFVHMVAGENIFTKKITLLK